MLFKTYVYLAITANVGKNTLLYILLKTYVYSAQFMQSIDTLSFNSIYRVDKSLNIRHYSIPEYHFTLSV